MSWTETKGLGLKCERYFGILSKREKFEQGYEKEREREKGKNRLVFE